MTDVKQRLLGPDIIRFIAALFVVMEHFFLNCGYYETPLNGKVMFIETAMRWMFLICVPLFLMLTGYFKSNKNADKQHYMSLVPIAVSYVVISIFKMILYNRLYGRIYTPVEAIKNLGNYNIAWYMGLYMGLMILAPFLNILWKSLKSSKEQKLLIGSLIFLCSLYPVFNYIAPSFYIGFYPVLYYYLGVYIRENQPKIPKWILIIAFAIIVLLEAVISYIGARGGMFNWNLISMADSGYGGVFVVASTVLLFLIFYDIDFEGKIIRRLLSTIGGVTFEIYLLAGAYDALIYGYLKNNKGLVNGFDFFPYFIFCTIGSFVLATISALIFKSVYKAVHCQIINRSNRH